MKAIVCKTKKHGAVRIGDTFHSNTDANRIVTIVGVDEIGYLISSLVNDGEAYLSNMSKGELNKEYTRC